MPTLPTRDEVAERIAAGKALRSATPRSSHGRWAPAGHRPDPVRLIERQNADRLPWLVPLRRGRMLGSAFAFFRGAAAVMTADLAETPTAGLEVQLCGDAHLANFGVYGSPERRLVFDVNDFDETLRGPFEWDVKRLATSVAVAARHHGWHPDEQRELATGTVRSYRTAMRGFAEQGWLTTWYTSVSVDDLAALDDPGDDSKASARPGRRRAEKLVAKARSRDHLQAAARLVERVADGYRFASDPPLLVPLRELPDRTDAGQLRTRGHTAFHDYRSSLDEQTRWLLDRYRLLDIALKVVGVGSVGTRCYVVLLLGRRADDVLLLQIKEAAPTVLAGHLPPSPYRHQGRRVIEGQRLMQATSDIFLGWCRSSDGRDHYVRQLRDWKLAADLDTMGRRRLARYAELCGWSLARAHAVSGDPAALAGYLGKKTAFDEAVAEFAVRYADQNATDHYAYTAAVRDGGLSVERERG